MGRHSKQKRASKATQRNAKRAAKPNRAPSSSFPCSTSSSTAPNRNRKKKRTLQKIPPHSRPPPPTPPPLPKRPPSTPLAIYLSLPPGRRSACQTTNALCLSSSPHHSHVSHNNRKEVKTAYFSFRQAIRGWDMDGFDWWFFLGTVGGYTTPPPVLPLPLRCPSFQLSSRMTKKV